MGAFALRGQFAEGSVERHAVENSVISQWASNIQNPTIKEEANQIIYRNWADVDPEGFLAIAETIDIETLSEDTQETLKLLKAAKP